MASRMSTLHEESEGEDLGFAGEEAISSDEQMNTDDESFLDDGIQETEVDHNAVDRALDALLSDGESQLGTPEVSVAAQKAKATNKRKANGRSQRAAQRRRNGEAPAKPARKSDRGVNARNWCFTIYDCPKFAAVFALDDATFPVEGARMVKEIFEAAKVSVSYLFLGKEVCPTTNRIHLQCFSQFATKKRLTCLKKVEKSIHYEACKGTPQQNRDYCKKGGLLSELGELPLTGAQATKVMWDDTLMHARKGDMLAINSRILITQVRNLERIHQRFGIRTEFLNPKAHTGVWIFSRTPGRGKTDCLSAQFPAIYKKAQDLQWNDYSGQEFAVIDDFAAEAAKRLAGELKLWTHHESFTGRILYGTVPVHLRRLFVTSNYSLEELFQPLGDQIYLPIKARFRCFNWDDGDITWDQRAPDCWSEDNILKCPLGETYDYDGTFY
nr:putative replication associated protein [Crucivirus sp.]